MNKYKSYVLLAVVTAIPILTSAQDLNSTNRLLGAAKTALNTVIGIAILLAFLFFIVGIVNFIRNAGDPTGRSEGRQQMIWGVIALAVLASIWGIVQWLTGELGLTDAPTPRIWEMFGIGGNTGSNAGGSGNTITVP